MRIWKRLQDDGDQREQIPQRVARGNENEDAQSRPREILLELQIAIRGQEDFEPVGGGASQQLAVSDAGPALLLHRADAMASKISR
jgi:hypothetical protein